MRIIQTGPLFSIFATKTRMKTGFSLHTSRGQVTGYCKDLEVGWGGGGSKVTSLYSVVELLKQRAGRNCCSSVCAACVYERVWGFLFFLLFWFFKIIFNYEDAQ